MIRAIGHVFTGAAQAFWHDLTLIFSWSEWRRTFQSLRGLTIRKTGRNLVLIVPQLLVFYLVLSPLVAMPLYNLLLFHPMKAGLYSIKKVVGVKKEDVQIEVPGGSQIHGWYFGVPDSKGTMMISHGNGGNITSRIPLIAIFLRNGFSVLAYDYEGYGYSEGTPSIDKVCSDGLAAYDYLLQFKQADPHRLILYGESLGGGVSCYVASKRQCAGIILQSSFSSLPHLASQRILFLKAYPRFLYPANILDNLQILQSDHAPLLIIHGRLDNLIPCTESEYLFAHAKEPKQLALLPNAAHNDVYDTQVNDLSSVVSGFLTRH